MKTSSEKEKKLSLALSKLKNLNHKNPSLTNAIQNLDDQKNQLEIEKKEIEIKYENLMQDYGQLKQKLDKINKIKYMKKRKK
jgi:DNA repair ATPase RecN